MQISLVTNILDFQVPSTVENSACLKTNIMKRLYKLHYIYSYYIETIKYLLHPTFDCLINYSTQIGCYILGLCIRFSVYCIIF